MEPYIIRLHRDGDMKWIVSRHGALYAREQGWGKEYEALVAEIVEKLERDFDPEWERCWIAERDGQRVGSLCLVRKAEGVAQLRLFLVKPEARGLGIGNRLVNECIRFAREKDYRKIVLWTVNGLDASRHIYEKVGFHLIHEEPNRGFGDGLTSQTWELTL